MTVTRRFPYSSHTSILLFTAILLLFLPGVYGQEKTDPPYGGSIGLSLAFGSTVNRLGIGFNAFYFEDFVQINSSLRFFYNLRTFGPRGKCKEMQASLGAIGAWGENDGYYYRFLHPVSNQTGYRYSAGYAYTVYLDNHQTSQPTGMIGLQVNQAYFIHENDILAGTGDDRFRTGGLIAGWQEDDFRLAITYLGWTGDPKTNMAKLFDKSNYPARRGYKDLSASTHGKFSHGIVALQAEGVLDYGQVIRGNLGIDAEQIRNFMQNRLMHELITKGFHYPMLDTEGVPYLYNTGQKIRPVKPFYQISLNPPVFY